MTSNLSESTHESQATTDSTSEVTFMPGKCTKCPSQKDLPYVGSGTAIIERPTAFVMFVNWNHKQPVKDGPINRKQRRVACELTVVKPRCPSVRISFGATTFPEMNIEAP